MTSVSVFMNNVYHRCITIDQYKYKCSGILYNKLKILASLSFSLSVLRERERESAHELGFGGRAKG